MVTENVFNNAEWGGEGINVPTRHLFSTGQNNTNLILSTFAQNGISELVTAAYICNNLVLNGYSDWYLLLLEELNLIYQN